MKGKSGLVMSGGSLGTVLFDPETCIVIGKFTGMFCILWPFGCFMCVCFIPLVWLLWAGTGMVRVDSPT